MSTYDINSNLPSIGVTWNDFDKFLGILSLKKITQAYKKYKKCEHTSHE